MNATTDGQKFPNTDRGHLIFGISLLLVCGFAMAIDLFHARMTASARENTATEPGAFKVTNLSGHQILAHNDAALVAVVQYGCVHCERSLPFYKRLADLERRGQTKVPLVFVAPNTTDELRETVGPSIAADHLIPLVNINDMGVSGTPTLLLVERMHVVRAWVGELTDRQKANVTSYVRQAKPER